MILIADLPTLTSTKQQTIAFNKALKSPTSIRCETDVSNYGTISSVLDHDTHVSGANAAGSTNVRNAVGR